MLGMVSGWVYLCGVRVYVSCWCYILSYTILLLYYTYTIIYYILSYTIISYTILFSSVYTLLFLFFCSIPLLFILLDPSLIFSSSLPMSPLFLCTFPIILIPFTSFPFLIHSILVGTWIRLSILFSSILLPIFILYLSVLTYTYLYYSNIPPSIPHQQSDPARSIGVDG